MLNVKAKKACIGKYYRQLSIMKATNEQATKLCCDAIQIIMYYYSNKAKDKIKI